jgi:hypothetical protein
MITFERPLYDGASAELGGGLFLLWDRGPGAPSLQDALMSSLIRQRLESLSSHGVFDSVEFRLEGATIMLTGMAANRELPLDALQVLSELPLVERVINLIELLPESLEDDMIRAEAYARLYADPVLASYRSPGMSMDGFLPAPSGRPRHGFGFHAIRLLVKSGDLTLAGQVASRADADRACRLARTVHGVVNVHCRLMVTGNWN